MHAPQPADQVTTWLGVDTGGTFTDFVLLQQGRLTIHKVLSTPEQPERAIIQGARELGIEEQPLRLVHGSTVATNAVLEGKGVEVTLITNRGLGDLLALGRQGRDQLYDLAPQPIAPPVPSERCLETGGRLGADGSVVEPLTEADLEAIRKALAAQKPAAVAINLLFSFLDPRFELQLAELVPEGTFVSRSSAILPEYREYERGITTWLNAYVGPRMEGYLQRLQAGLPQAQIAVMQSSGERIDAARAGEQAVHLLLSGPAGGLIGGRHIGELTDEPRLLSFDMGGTSTDVAVIDGEPQLTSEGHIGPYPVGVPMVDMHTIGAGGGSIAQVDAGGALQVGPASAGAHPGPACYGRGGTAATVTDAHCVLGRLPPGQFLGGGMELDTTAAHAALGRLGKALGTSAEEAAAGVLQLANEHMARALRVISVERGLDPRDFALLSFGGAGGLHVCALAEELGMTRALVPIHSGVLSALGMLAAPRGRQLSQTVARPWAALDTAEIERGLARLATDGRAALQAEGLAAEQIEEVRRVELRYQGQAFTLTVDWHGDDPNAVAEAFHRAHEARYGHRLDEPLELVNLRLAVRGPRPPLELPDLASTDRTPQGATAIHGEDVPVPIWQRAHLPLESAEHGPMLVVDAVSTTWVAAGWQAQRDRRGNLLLERNGADA
ncbi:MAG: hydantoinase/oxoprolinase family protein [Halorhodospira sp.]